MSALAILALSASLMVPDVSGGMVPSPGIESWEKVSRPVEVVVVERQPVPIGFAMPADVKPRPARVASLNERQTEHARTIVRVGQERGIPEQGLVVAIATAMQETTMRNLGNPAHPRSLELPNDGVGFDHDSVGLFQQRPASGWGTVDELMDPEISAGKFYHALVRVDGWQRMSVTQAAQRVQRSAHPNAYAQWESLARQVVAELGGAEK
jgi:hypothetical protein